MAMDALIATVGPMSLANFGDTSLLSDKLPVRELNFHDEDWIPGPSNFGMCLSLPGLRPNL